ncbi:hypothetical protein DFH28DRAFT_981190 [Melampsora americana]|nr:hypothetical protein DFH28DRAFT_981190 [Melampsora americana]
MPALTKSISYSEIRKSNQKERGLYRILEEEHDQIINIHEDHQYGSEIEHSLHPQLFSKCPISHSYRKRSLGSPCPAISILINHSYLHPIDSNDPIPFYQLIFALVKCFNLSWIHATFLTFLANSFYGNLWRDSLNPSEERLEKFLNLSNLLHDDNRFTLGDFSRSRKLAETEAQKFRPMTRRGIFAGMGEVGLVMSVFGQNTSFEFGKEPWLRKDWMKIIFIEERLPQGWIRPTRPISILQIHWFIKALKQLMV